MANSLLPNDTPNTHDAQTHGIAEIRQKTIGRMIAQGLPVKYVAKKLQMSESRIYHLLSDKESIVNAEINWILGEIFTANDRYLVKLFNITLQNLHTMLSSPDKEKQFRAMDRIIKIYMARSAKNGVTVQQYFGLEMPEAKREFGWDDYVQFRHKLKADMDKKRRERGLPSLEELLNFAEQNYPSPGSASPAPEETPASNESSPANSPPETPAPNESLPNNSPQEIAAQNESSRGAIPSGVPEDIRKFVEDMDEPPPSE